MYNNVFYIPTIKTCNGIMTFIRNIAMKYHDWDIVVFYKDCEDEEQLKLLKQYIRVIKYINQKIICEKAFFNNDKSIIDNVQANEYTMIIHSNAEEQLKYNTKFDINKKINTYYGVSKLACDKFEQVYGKKAETLYTPVIVNKPRRVLRLVSFTRLDTDDKASHNYRQFANMLEESGYPFTWLIYTPDRFTLEKQGVAIMQPVQDVSSYMKDADYVVQLSKENVEGFCLTVSEALSLGVPIISTEQAVYKELGINDKYGFIVDEDLINVSIDDIYNRAGTFDFVKKPPKDTWDKVLVPGKSQYEENKGKKYVVEALDTYRLKGISDGELKIIPDIGHRWVVDADRLEVLLGNNEEGLIFAKLIEECKEEPKKRKIKRTNPLVSVVIPVYNQEKLIVKAINSIPKRDDIEIIVVDDKSTDNTLKVLKSMTRKITIIENKKNMGVGYTFNQGIDAAKGEYLIRMDSDDYMYGKVFNDIVDNELDGTDMIYYDLEINSGMILPTTKQNRRGRCGTVKFIRREFIGDTRCPEIRTAEDKYFNDALLDKNPTEKFTSKVLIHYNYPREGSLYNLTVKGELKV